MKIAGISGVRRGRVPVTTRPVPVSDTRPDLVSREFKAGRPNELWVADMERVKLFVCGAGVYRYLSKRSG